MCIGNIYLPLRWLRHLSTGASTAASVLKENMSIVRTREPLPEAPIENEYMAIISDNDEHLDHTERVRVSIQCDSDQKERGRVSIQCAPMQQIKRKRCWQWPPWWGSVLMALVIILLSVDVYMSRSLLKTVCDSLHDPDKMPVFKDCKGAYNHGQRTSGVYTISPSMQWSTMMEVYCEQELDGGGWLVFQARKDGSMNFYQDWNTYKAGFGDLMGEFWLGNSNIRLLTKHHDQQLKIELTSLEGEVAYADYTQFSIGNESTNYRLNVTRYTGEIPPGDSMFYHSDKPFSTSDRDNDDRASSCAVSRKGGWWYWNCANANLNGLYGGSGKTGMHWYHWKKYETMKATRMMMKKRAFD